MQIFGEQNDVSIIVIFEFVVILLHRFILEVFSA